jgi:hypothetical protein
MEHIGLNFALIANACLGAISVAAFVALAASSRMEPEKTTAESK